MTTWGRSGRWPLEWEAALLTEALLRRRGIRDRCRVDVYIPEPAPMHAAGPRIGQTVADLLARRGIELPPATTSTASPRTTTGSGSPKLAARLGHVILGSPARAGAAHDDPGTLQPGQPL